MITYDTIQKIGCLIGIPYVNFNGCYNIPDDASDGVILTSGEAKIIETENRPPLLIFTGMCPGVLYNIKGENNTKSIYVLNLFTLKPTKKSYLQIELPIELKNLIKSEISKK